MGEDNANLKKLLDKLPEGFADGMSSADTEEIKNKILESEQHLYDIDQEKDKNEELKRAREIVKDLSSSFRKAKVTESAKIKYCLMVLEDRGVNL